MRVTPQQFLAAGSRVKQTQLAEASAPAGWDWFLLGLAGLAVIGLSVWWFTQQRQPAAIQGPLPTAAPALSPEEALEADRHAVLLSRIDAL